MVLYLLTYVSKIPNTYTTLYVDPYFQLQEKAGAARRLFVWVVEPISWGLQKHLWSPRQL